MLDTNKCRACIERRELAMINCEKNSVVLTVIDN